MKRIVSKAGFSLLEGLIALGLLAMVAGGTFGVLLSVSQKSGRSDIREEMVLAIEKANDLLQIYTQQMSNADMQLPAGMRSFCSDNYPLKNGAHNINCLLPLVCDSANSSFTYTVSSSNQSIDFTSASDKMVSANYNSTAMPQREITFQITCNGYTL